MAITHDHTQIPTFSTFFDPSDTPNFTINWSAFLGTANVATSTWTLPAGLSIANGGNGEFIDTQSTTVILEGLSADNTYEIANTITTDDATPLTFERSFKFTTKNL